MPLRFSLFLLCILLCCTSLWASISVVGNLTRVQTVQPSSIYYEEVTVYNKGVHSTSINLYQNDYVYFDNGENGFLEPGKLKRSNASWITNFPVKTTIPAHDSLLIRFRITVPTDSLVGSYWSVLFIEEDKPKTANNTIVANTRYGLQFISQIRNTGTINMHLKPASFTKVGIDYLLAIPVENTGEQMTDPKVYTEVYDSSNQPIGTFYADQRRLLPDTSHTFRIPVPQLLKGTYHCMIIADCGHDNIYGLQYNLNIP